MIFDDQAHSREREGESAINICSLTLPVTHLLTHPLTLPLTHRLIDTVNFPYRNHLGQVSLKLLFFDEFGGRNENVIMKWAQCKRRNIDSCLVWCW